MIGGPAALFVMILLGLVIAAGLYALFVGEETDRHSPFHDEEERKR